MVGIDIPERYTLSPSFVSATPQLTINHDVGLDLDSTNAFEGPEKLLEVWFAPSPDLVPASAHPRGLKIVSEESWKTMLDLVNCQVLSVLRSDEVDAYLLSESSMFVYPHKIVLKTCGTTTLLYGIPRMLELAALGAGFEHMPADAAKGTSAAALTYQLFYSRKNFLNPDQQHGPHRSWRDEVKYLDHTFPGGSAYMIGKMNGEHWYLYLTGPNHQLTPPMTPESGNSSPLAADLQVLTTPGHMSLPTGMETPDAADAADETLEILMMDLDEDNAKQFYLDHAKKLPSLANGAVNGNGSTTGVNDNGVENIPATQEKTTSYLTLEQQSTPAADPDDLFMFDSNGDEASAPIDPSTEGHVLGAKVSASCGLDSVYPREQYPEARVDAYLFTPCGFSANGIVPIPAAKHQNGTNGTHDGHKPPDRLTAHYFTVHVTPEPHCSYASFETNVPTSGSGRTTADVIDQVVRIFRPGRFTVTLFEAKPTNGVSTTTTSKNGHAHNRHGGSSTSITGGNAMDRIPGYRRVDRIVHDLDGYELVFRYYERFGFPGAAPRLGDED